MRSSSYPINFNFIICPYPLNNAPIIFGFDCHLAMIVVPSMPLHAIVQLFEQLRAFLRFFINVFLRAIVQLGFSEPKEVSYLLPQIHITDRHCKINYLSSTLTQLDTSNLYSRIIVGV